jgi:NADPH-dependent methylglyoxal reductase
MPQLVLVTGASGFIADHVVSQLLEKHYYVRGTVRSQTQVDYFTTQYQEATESRQISFVVVEDIAQQGALKDAMKGYTRGHVK